MANHFSALKRARQTRRRTARNRRNKGVLRSGLREIREVMAGGDLDQIKLQMPAAFSRLDKATHKKVLHRNTAARLKSRLMGRLHALEHAQASPAA